MNFLKKNIFIFVLFLPLIILINCDGNTILEAIKKRESMLFTPDSSPDSSYYYEYEVSNITATQIFGTKNVLLTWDNPKDSNFNSVIIVRKLNSFATSIEDPLIKFIYSGKGNTFIDSDLSGDTIYYWTLFTKSKDSKYSKGVNIKKEVINTGITENPYYEKDISNLTLNQVPATKNVNISWTNPVDTKFDGVLILRKENTFPTGYNDTSAELIYLGTGTGYTDLYLTEGRKYCYTLYCKNKDAKFSKGVSQSIIITGVSAITYNYDVNDFIATKGKDNREVILNWINPTDSNFVEVRLLRRTGQYPTSYNDGSATLLYTGTNQRYIDSNLTPGTTYYYTIYAKNKEGYYSAGVNAYRSITETSIDIRRRSFFIIGGSSNYTTPQSNIVTQVDMFDPLTETLYPNVTTMPTGKYFCSATSVQGKIYVFGGLNSTPAATNTLDILDVNTLTWSTGAPLTGMNNVALQLVQWNNKIYTVGGTTGTTGANATADGRRYDPITNTWMADNNNIYADISSARYNFCATVYDGIIYYFGGQTSAGAFNNTGNYYSILNNSTVAITASAAMNNKVGAASTLYRKILPNGYEKIVWFIIGGPDLSASSTALPHANASLSWAGTSTLFMLELPSYNGVPNWLQVFGVSSLLNTNRIYGGAESYGDYIYVFGGANNASVLTSIEKLYINNGMPQGSWINIGNLTIGRFGFAITKVNY